MHVIYMSVHTGIQAAHRTDSHGHCPQNRLTCANQQAEPLPPSASSHGELRRGGRRTTHRRRLSPHTEDTGFKECYSGTSNHDDRGTGAPLLAAKARHRRVKTPTRPRHLSADPYPPTVSRRRTALPARPVRQRPADHANDPDRPAMYPGDTSHPPTVDLRRYRASPSGPADSSDSADERILTRRAFYAQPCILSHGSFDPISARVQPFPLFR